MRNSDLLGLDKMIQMLKLHTSNISKSKRIRANLRTKETDIYTEVCTRVSEIENKYCSSMEEDAESPRIQRLLEQFRNK